jgi:hypothetical protein
MSQYMVMDACSTCVKYGSNRVEDKYNYTNTCDVCKISVSGTFITDGDLNKDQNETYMYKPLLDFRSAPSPWNRAFLNLTVTQLLNTFSALNGT